MFLYFHAFPLLMVLMVITGIFVIGCYNGLNASALRFWHWDLEWWWCVTIFVAETIRSGILIGFDCVSMMIHVILSLRHTITLRHNAEECYKYLIAQSRNAESVNVTDQSQEAGVRSRIPEESIWTEREREREVSIVRSSSFWSLLFTVMWTNLQGKSIQWTPI